MENDYNVYFNTIKFGTSNTVVTPVVMPDTIEVNNTFFKVTKFIAKSSVAGLLHLHSRTLASDKSYNNANGNNDLISTFTTNTGYTIYNEAITEKSLGLPVPSWLVNNPTVTLYLTDENYVLSSNLTNVEMELAIWKRRED